MAGFEVLAAIIDADDDDPVVEDCKQNGHATLEAQRAQPRREVIACGPTLRGAAKVIAIGDDTPDIGVGP